MTTETTVLTVILLCQRGSSFVGTYSLYGTFLYSSLGDAWDKEYIEKSFDEYHGYSDSWFTCDAGAIRDWLKSNWAPLEYV